MTLTAESPVPEAPGTKTELDPIELAVMSSRMEAIVREMTNTVVLTARSSVIGLARDMSCSILTPECELIAAAEGLPIHIYASMLQARSMHHRHPDFAQGDAFLHNDPYDGGTHPADHAIIVPVFWGGEHRATVVVTCHQADVGNALPTTYMAGAKDVYEEGALIFPCVKVHSGYVENQDIINMCRRRIRVPEIWYGDHTAAVGAARVGERRLQQYFEQYGAERVSEFVSAWFDYSERRTRQAIRSGYASGEVTVEAGHDPVGDLLPAGIDVKATYVIDAEVGHISVDQTDNPDCPDAGLNLTEATATMGTMQGIFNCLDDVPLNSGTLRCVDVKLRENCAFGIPTHPHSASCATAPTVDLLVNMAQYAFAQLGTGMAEGNWSNSAGAGVVSGKDPRHGDRDYVDQIFIMGGGGPGTPTSDGLTYYLIPPGAGLLYRDSIEIDEQRIPFLIESMRVLPDSAGIGRHRGGPATEVVYGPRMNEMTIINISNGQVRVPRGVHGGGPSLVGRNEKLAKDGSTEVQPAFMQVTLEPGDVIRAVDQGGGGYGDPLERDPQRVLRDVEEQFVSEQAALTSYGVVLTGSLADDTLAVDDSATQAERASRQDGRTS
jgi:N-methylhydantoinase B